ncbi:hypothetical protein PHLCEN_2v11144 [Hermanssonia centrifuga]|uniref:Uncharacterized protein n=1 Tax=Hermanssonia centrifuga TaxID=98765 RepID=A0A2R6NKX6_9APHY|nr:hypothetical protein PHLCEN_2v11144 [Hermanssonia centrifuga]
MAALYLHQALFASDIPPQPSIVHRIGSPHEQQLSSISTGTLRTTTTDHSHPSEPLLHTPYTESSVYLDLLSRQPLHPDEAARTSWVPTLSLESDPMTPRERRRLREEVKRKRIRRLKWVKNILVGIAEPVN